MPIENYGKNSIESDDIKKVDAKQILLTIDLKSRLMKWSEAIDILRKSKSHSSGFIPRLFGEGYKPVYFA